LFKKAYSLKSTKFQSPSKPAAVVRQLYKVHEDLSRSQQSKCHPARDHYLFRLLSLEGAISTITMDLCDELENLAITATFEEPEQNAVSCDPTQGTIRMWQERFGYTYEEAAERLQIISIAKKQSAVTRQETLLPAQARTIYALKLEGPISTPQKVQIVANLSTIPKSYYGSGEEGDAVFCKIDGKAEKAIEHWLFMQTEVNFGPLFVPEGKAYKELCSGSLYPTLGKDATLPQYRPQDPHLLDTTPSFGRAHDQFPVWYFFYGTLANIPKLQSLLSLPEDEKPVLHEASVMGGKMETWSNGKYNALIDGPENRCVKGLAYQVMSEEHEDALRKYETSVYEVVRCLIKIGGATVEGCTFRFVGQPD
jgi:hypothetical protein